MMQKKKNYYPYTFQKVIRIMKNSRRNHSIIPTTLLVPSLVLSFTNFSN